VSNYSIKRLSNYGMHMEKMKAIICIKYGAPEVLVLGEVLKPYPKKNEVSIKVHATTVSSGDCRMRSLNLSGVPFIQRIFARLVMGILKPRYSVQGLWLAGEIEAVGESVKYFRVGDKVYARTPDMKFGAYAEYACLPENGVLSLMPLNLTYEEAIAIPFGGITAWYFLKKANVKNGDKVMIYGASGAVGSMAVQIATYFGAFVTGVCSTSNIDLIKSFGAYKVVDYIKDDFTADNELYDIVFDAVGKITYKKIKPLLKPGGKFISVVTSGHAQLKTEDLITITELVEQGEIKPVIDRVYAFEQMPEAHRYVELGHKKGNVVITLD
jgi:NADPH:quinone reductase-like Zn-dependent oxidoreductase